MNSVFPDIYISDSFEEIWDSFDNVSQLLNDKDTIIFFDKWFNDFYQNDFPLAKMPYIKYLSFSGDNHSSLEEDYLSTFAVSPILILKCAQAYMMEYHDIFLEVEEDGTGYCLKFWD